MKSKLKIQRRDGLLLAIFYTIVGIVQIIALTQTNFGLYTSGILAVLSFIAAYGLFTVKKWSVWLVIALFFPQLAFDASILYTSIIRYISSQEIAFLLLNIGLAVFTGLSFISFVYVAAKRKTFQ